MVHLPPLSMGGFQHKTLPVGVGSVVAGKYRIDRLLGAGGMGVVAEAFHVELNQRVAVKFVTDLGEDSVARFLREARAAAQIRSEHVVKVTDVGTADGLPYMVMEYLEGRDLAQLERESQRLAISDVVDYVLQACEAVAEAHAQGMVHRDLKPANLFLTTRSDGSSLVKVLDFGISKVKKADADVGHDITSTQAMLGSPAYMSPEQMKSTKNVDARADIWSLGAVLFELLTGQQPFASDSLPELVAHIMTSEPTQLTTLRDVPAPLAQAVHRCLRKEPSDRWQNVAELAGALLPFGSRSARLSAERIVGVMKRSGQFAPSLPPSVMPPAQRHDDDRPVTAGVAPAQDAQGAGVATQSSWATAAGSKGSGKRAVVWGGAAIGLVLVGAVAAWIAASAGGEHVETASSSAVPAESIVADDAAAPVAIAKPDASPEAAPSATMAAVPALSASAPAAVSTRAKPSTPAVPKVPDNKPPDNKPPDKKKGPAVDPLADPM